MYIPSHFSASEEGVSNLLSHIQAAELITNTSEGLIATFLPFVFDPTEGDHGSLKGHVARNNTQWKLPAAGKSLVIYTVDDAYISPSWYATKKEHGRVVPTWNYLSVHLYGDLVIHDDPTWVGNLVRELTNKHEEVRPIPWEVDDAPADYLQGQLRAIVGVELVIDRIEAKFKMSQNRGESDSDGVVAGLREDGHDKQAGQVQRLRPKEEH